MYPGSRILFKLCCPQCGEPLPNYQSDVSDFFFFKCHNKECRAYMAEILVERRTGQVLSAWYTEFKDAYGKRYCIKYEEVVENKEEK